MTSPYDQKRLNFSILMYRQGKAWSLLLIFTVLTFLSLGTAISRSYLEWRKLQEELLSLQKQMKALTLIRIQGDSEGVTKNELLKSLQSKKVVEKGLNRIFEIALKNEIDLTVGDYKWIVDSSTNISRYQISYPVVATYSQVEQFVVQVMFDMPWVSLDSFSIRRATIKDADIEANIIFTLHFDAQSIATTDEGVK